MLAYHMRKAHAIPAPLSKDKNFKCPSCKKMFANKVHLADHIARDHEKNAKVYKCNYCSLETHYKVYLRKHVRLFHSKDEMVTVDEL